MKIKLSDMQGILGSSIYNKALPVKTSFALSRLVKKLSSELQTFEDERQKLIEKYEGKISEDGSQYTFTPENMKEFSKEVSDLLACEIDVAFEPLTLESFGNVDLTPNDLLMIAPLMKDEE